MASHRGAVRSCPSSTGVPRRTPPQLPQQMLLLMRRTRWQHYPSEADGQDFQDDPPYQVAPGDSYRRQESVPDRVFVGNGLIRRLRQNNLLGQCTATGAKDEWINRASVPVAAPPRDDGTNT